MSFPKCCAICCLVAVVLLAILVPIGVFVIAPKQAQSMIDGTVVTLRNSTLIPNQASPVIVDGGWATLYINSTLQTPGPFGATLNPYEANLSTFGTTFGRFEFPKENIKVGLNEVNFIANCTILNATSLTNWTMTWLLLDPTAVINLQITGKASASAFGLTFHPEQNVNLWCIQLQPSPDTGISMVCTKDYPKQLQKAQASPSMSSFISFGSLEGAPARSRAKLGLPGCPTTACPAACQCGEKSCSAAMTACLADSSCAPLQGCAEACKCGDKACLMKCGLKSPSTKAFALVKCLTARCPVLLERAVEALPLAASEGTGAQTIVV